MTINVQLTPDYRLTADERNYIVKRRHIVDPTKAPGYKTVEGVEPPPVRESWDHPQNQSYYPLNAAGLSSALEHVMLRTAGSEARTIGELLASYRDESARLRAVISAALSTEVGA